MNSFRNVSNHVRRWNVEYFSVYTSVCQNLCVRRVRETGGKVSSLGGGGGRYLIVKKRVAHQPLLFYIDNFKI